jgi:phytoene/squalene synthetase
VLDCLCLIEAEISSSLAAQDHHVAHVRLQWWREECARGAAGKPLHPLTRKLLDSCPPGSLSGLSGLTDAAAWDLAAATFETRHELQDYCERWAGALIEPLAAQAISSVTLAAATSAPSWRRLGAALREIELLASLEQDARGGRLRLPLDELDAARVPCEQLASPPWPAALTTLLRARHEALRSSLEAVVSGIEPAWQPALRGLLVWVSLAWRLSRLAQLALPGPLPVTRLDAVSASLTAWRAARAALSGHYRLPYGSRNDRSDPQV